MEGILAIVMIFGMPVFIVGITRFFKFKRLKLTRLGELDARARARDLTLSSMCTVFAESEVVSLIAEGADVAEIVNALHRAIATRTLALVRRVAPDAAGLSVAMSGGVARNPGVVRAIGDALGCEVHVPPEPDTVGALGAALIARDRAAATPRHLISPQRRID